MEFSAEQYMAAQMVAEYIQAQQQEMGASNRQMDRYRTQGTGTYFLKEVIARRWWDGGVEPHIFSNDVSVVKIVGKPVTAKTGAEGEALALNVNPGFQAESLAATGKFTKFHGIKAADVAADLAQMWDPIGRRVVSSKSHSWIPWERQIILWAKEATVNRAYDRLPVDDPDYNHVIVDEVLIGHVLGRKIGVRKEGKVVDFVQARLATPQATEEGNNQRDELPDKSKKAEEIYGKTGGKLDRPDIKNEQLENKAGNRKAWAAQNNALKEEALRVRNLLIHRGLVPFTGAQLYDPSPEAQERFDIEIMSALFELWMDDQGIDPERRVIVPNTYVSADDRERKGYHAGLIEAKTLHIFDYVTLPEVLKARSYEWINP